MNHEIVDSAESFEAALARVRAAQAKFGEYTQEQVDKIFLAAASAANKMRIPLAKMAVEETGMGIVEDKVIKNTMPRSIFSTPTRMSRPAASSKPTRHTALPK